MKINLSQCLFLSTNEMNKQHMVTNVSVTLAIKNCKSYCGGVIEKNFNLK